MVTDNAQKQPQQVACGVRENGRFSPVADKA
jgi:hypothetical protein